MSALRLLRMGGSVAALAVLTVMALAEPVLAHPFGPPLRAEVAADGALVTIRWSAAEDDWVGLASHVGAFAEVPADSADGPLSGVQRLQRSQRLRSYLLERIEVSQEGVPCDGRLLELERFQVEGVLLGFDCPTPVAQVEVRIAVLTDVHEAYRTVAVVPGRAERVLFTRSEPVRDLNLAGTGGAGGRAPGTAVGGGRAPMAGSAAYGALDARLLAAFDRPAAIWLAVLMAFGVGVLHALAPGHGKSIAVAYLMAGRSRHRHAALLGVTVAGMHTLSVAVLAVAWTALSASTSLATQRVTAWLQVVAALCVLAVGVTLLRRRLVGGDHHHHHHAGASATETDRPGGRRRMVVALAAGGGLLPSPSAFLVLVSGLLTGRVAYALLLVLSFAIGMAATLAGVGVTVLHGRDVVLARAEHGPLGLLNAYLPTLAAAGVVLGGLVYLLAAVRAVAGT